jgi:hypothetical protein
MIVIGFILGLAFLLGGMVLVRGLIIVGLLGFCAFVILFWMSLESGPDHYVSSFHHKPMMTDMIYCFANDAEFAKYEDHEFVKYPSFAHKPCPPGSDGDRRIKEKDAPLVPPPGYRPQAALSPDDGPWNDTYEPAPADPQPRFNPRPATVPASRPSAPDAQLLDRWGTSAPDISWDETQEDTKPASPRANRLLRRLHEAQGVEAPL